MLNGWKTILVNALTGLSVLLAGDDVARIIDPKTLLEVSAAVNILLRLVTYTPAGFMTMAKGDVAKPLILIGVLIGTSGCATSKAPYFCSLATSDEVKTAATEIMKEVKPGTDKGKAVLAMSIVDISADAGCTALKAIEARKAK